VDTPEFSAHAHTTTDPGTRAGDPFAYAGERQDCPSCFGGYVTITVEEDGDERHEAVPCKRCAVASETL
jgi:hypothetical protein